MNRFLRPRNVKEIQLRKKLRKVLAEAADSANKSAATIRNLRRAVERAREDGATEVLRAKYLPEQIKDMRRQLTEKYGTEIAAPLLQLMAAGRRSVNNMIDLRAMYSMSNARRVMVVRGTIPEMNYNFYVEQDQP